MSHYSFIRSAPARWTWPLAALLCLTPVLVGSQPAGKPSVQSQAPSVPVKAAAVAAAPSTVTPSVAAPGAAAPAEPSGVRVLLTPALETVMLSQMVGRITTLNASLGSRVREGQVVVAFDCSEASAKLKMSEAELASARETYNNKARLKGLDAAGDVEVSLAASQVDRANGQIEMTKVQIQSCSVLAPFSGSISKLHVKPHQGVNAGQQLFEMISDGAPKLRLNVPSKWLRSLRVGTSFQMNIEETGGSYRGVVSALNTRVDPVAQTIEIEGKVVGKSAGLLPGMSGLAHFNGLH